MIIHKRTTARIFQRAKELRRELTPTERLLWARLRAHRTDDVHFRNRHAIGNYIVDFCAPRKKLVIEVDGSQHLQQQDYDAERTTFLQKHGYRVLRFSNHDINTNLEGVMTEILFQLDNKE